MSVSIVLCTALRMHTKHCLLRTHARIHSLTWLAVPARPYYSHSCLLQLQDYSFSTLVSTTLACPVVESWVGNITWRSGQIRASSQSSSNCGRHRRRPSLVDKFSPVRTPVFATSSLSSVLCDFFAVRAPTSLLSPPDSSQPWLLRRPFLVAADAHAPTCCLEPASRTPAGSPFFFPFVRSLSRRTHLIRPLSWNLPAQQTLLGSPHFHVVQFLSRWTSTHMR